MDTVVIQSRIRKSSPLFLAKELKSIELKDKKTAEDVINEVNEQFKSGAHLTNSVLKPIILSLADSILEIKQLSWLRKKGVTPSRIYTECEEFRYDNVGCHGCEVDAYNEYKNMRHEMAYDANYSTSHNASNMRSSMDQDFKSGKYYSKNMPSYNSKTREKYYDDDKAKADYQDKKFSGKEATKDEYTGETILRNETDQKKVANTDHIIPLKRVYEQFSGNPALNSEDIRNIANNDRNYALTSQSFNTSKGAKYNEDFKKYKRDEIDPKIHEQMEHQSIQAQNNVNDMANKAVFATLTGNGAVVERGSEYKKRYGEEFSKYAEEKEKESGRSLSRDERKKLNEEFRKEYHKKLQREKAKDAYFSGARAAISQQTDIAAGNIILYLLKPIYYELKDIFINGLEKGVGIEGKIAAIKFRFSRIKKYVIENAEGFLGDSVLQFIKGFISSLIEAIINMFVGAYKMLFKVVKEGFKILIRAIKLIWGEEGKKLSSRQKGDAILKLIGASIGALSGIGIEFALDKIPGMPQWLRLIISGLGSGMISALIMYALDKMDLFNTRAEMRRNALNKIFDQRLNAIDSAVSVMDTTAIEVMDKQRKSYDEIDVTIINALNNNDFKCCNEKIVELSGFFKIELPYNSYRDFVKAYDSNKELSLDIM